MEQNGRTAQTWFKLSPDIHVISENSGWNLVSERGALLIGGAPVEVGAILGALQTGVRLHDLVTLGKASVLQHVLLKLGERGWLIHEPDAEVGAQFKQVTGWLASQTSKPILALSAIERSTVAIIGLGGLGCQIAEHLAGAGVGRFILVDGDRVEASNLNRQYMFDHNVIGQKKVDVAGKRIAARCPTAEVVLHDQFMCSVADLECLDPYALQIVINCADQPTDIEKFVAMYCEHRSVPFITSGVGLHRGYWGPFLPDRQQQVLAACEEKVRKLQGSTVAQWDRARICTSSHGPYNSIIASHVATDVILHLTNIAKPKSLRSRLYMDFDQLRIVRVDIGPDGASSGAGDGI